MMDFIVSKVAMAVSALMVVAVLAGVLDGSRFVDDGSEVRRVLSDLCRTIETAFSADAEVDLVWVVPMTPTGAELRISVDGSLVFGESGGFRSAVRPVCELHTWAPTGVLLNRSTVEDLDRSAPVMTAVSGERVLISVELVLLDGSEELLVFVHSCP